MRGGWGLPSSNKPPPDQFQHGPGDGDGDENADDFPAAAPRQPPPALSASVIKWLAAAEKFDCYGSSPDTQSPDTLSPEPGSSGTGSSATVSSGTLSQQRYPGVFPQHRQPRNASEVLAAAAVAAAAAERAPGADGTVAIAVGSGGSVGGGDGGSGGGRSEGEGGGGSGSGSGASAAVVTGLVPTQIRFLLEPKTSERGRRGPPPPFPALLAGFFSHPSFPTLLVGVGLNTRRAA